MPWSNRGFILAEGEFRGPLRGGYFSDVYEMSYIVLRVILSGLHCKNSYSSVASSSASSGVMSDVDLARFNSNSVGITHPRHILCLQLSHPHRAPPNSL